MRHVPRQWLRWFQLGLVLFDVVVVGLYAYEVLFESTSFSLSGDIFGTGGEIASSWGITPLAAGLATIHAFYALGVIRWLDKNRTWLAHASSILISGVVLIVLANSSSSHIWYYDLLIIFMFFATMAGFIAPGVVFALAFVFLIISSLLSNVDPGSSRQVVEMILVSMSGLSGVAGWFVFNRKYVQVSDIHTVETLTNVVKQERDTVNLLLESITDGVMIINTSGTVELMNSSAAQILGWSKDEARNLQYTAMLQPAPVNTEEVQKQQQPDVPKAEEELAIAQAIKDREARQQVSLLKTRDNRQAYIDIAASPIFQDQAGAKNMVGIIAVLRNVDKQKREEQQRSEFISTASHEMRTPVAAIEGYLALALNDKVSGIDAKARNYLEKAHESTQHLGQLFQDLLTSTKAEDGRLSNHPGVVEMGQYLEQLVESLRFAAEKKGLFVEFVIGTGTPQEQSSIMSGKVVKPLYYVHADPDRMREVITNLFDNAVKYTSEGKVSVGLTGNDQVVQVYVRDTGPGIPPEDVGHLFQKFYRVDSSATRTAGGTGLGLFICRKIIELYKGRVWVESELNNGSTFYVNLPRLTTQKATEMQAAQAATTSALDQA